MNIQNPISLKIGEIKKGDCFFAYGSKPRQYSTQMLDFLGLFYSPTLFWLYLVLSCCLIPQLLWFFSVSLTNTQTSTKQWPAKCLHLHVPWKSLCFKHRCMPGFGVKAATAISFQKGAELFLTIVFKKSACSLCLQSKRIQTPLSSEYFYLQGKFSLGQILANLVSMDVLSYVLLNG